MDDNKDYIDDLKTIRNIMERSTRFISLSGLSGMLAGVLAIAGAFIVYRLLDGCFTLSVIKGTGWFGDVRFMGILFIAMAVLMLTLLAGVWLSYRKAVRQQQVLWGPGSKQFLMAMLIPLVSGGLFILVLISQGYYGLIIPSCLIFYGIALAQGARYTISGIQWLGYAEILLALAGALFPGYDLIFWIAGFGILNLIYGVVMSIRYGL